MAIALAVYAGYQVISAAQQAEVVRLNAEVQKKISNMNAKYAEIDAYNAEIKGISEAERYQTVIDSTIGAQKEAYASQNVDVNFGTAAAVQADTKLTGYLNQIDIRNQARMQAQGYKNQAGNYRMQAFAEQAQGQLQAGAIQASGYSRAFETGLGMYTGGKAATPVQRTNLGGND